MVGVAQLAERRIVAPKVEGSSPFSHPICAVSSAGQSRGLLIPRSRVRIPDGAPCELRNARRLRPPGVFLLRVAARRLLGKAPTCMGRRMRRARGFVCAEVRRNRVDGVADKAYVALDLRARVSQDQPAALWRPRMACGPSAHLRHYPQRYSSVIKRLPRRGNCLYFTW